MKKIAVTLMLMCCFLINTVASASMILEYDGGVHNYTGAVYELAVNGKTLSDLPLEPIIFNDRALVPVREVFEALGAKVDYEESDKSIIISYGKKSVGLKIGSYYATVDKKKKTIPDKVAPRLIAKWGESAKTMVPVRFISESVGLDVDFVEDKGLISISDGTVRPSANPTLKPTESPMPSFDNKLNKLTYSEKDGVVTITVFASNEIGNISKAAVTASGVLYTDVDKASYSVDNKTEVLLGAVKAVRFGQHETATRIALDTENMEKYSVSLSADRKAVVIKVSSDKNADVTPNETPEPTASPSAKPSSKPTANPSASPSASPTPSATPKPIKYNSEKIVVIDAGHGGSDPGASGYLMTEEEKEAYYAALESTEVILPTMKPGTGKKYDEKDIALTVAKKVRDNLKDNGIKVIMTRDKDVYPTLDARPELANEEGAVIFVSIHLNSTTSAVTAAKGIEVYYSEQNNDDDISLTSKQLATILLDKVLDSTDAKSRGVKTGNLLVNRKCMMPSALIEIGFMNNPDELELMATESYQDKLAAGISQGIIAAHKKVKLP